MQRVAASSTTACVKRAQSTLQEACPLIFLSHCSIRIEASAIRADAEAISPLTQRLGEQHGEEEKGKGGGKEGREEDEAPEEEVGSRHFTVFDIALMSLTASHGPAAA